MRSYFVLLALLLYCFHVNCLLIPLDWERRINQSQMLFAPSIPQDVNLMPYIGNGYIASVVYSDSIYASGIYIGVRLPWLGSYRARIPSTVSIFLHPNSSDIWSPIGGAIDFENGIYFNRSIVNTDTLVEQRWYAHRSIRSLMVYEVQIDNSKQTTSATLHLSNPNLFESKDILFKKVDSCFDNPTVTCYVGKLHKGETDYAPLIEVAVVTTKLQTIVASPKTTPLFRFMTAIRSTLDSTNPIADAYQDYITHIKQDSLQQSHEQAWNELWYGEQGGGIEIIGDVQLGAHVNSSWYYLLSSVRENWDWPLSPASLATTCYRGAVFWDNELWMLPNLMLYHPTIAQGSFNYRTKRLNEAYEYAKKQNHQGAQYPFLSGYTGHEVDLFPMFNKLEIHISPDIAFAYRQFFFLTNDETWLREIALPVVSGIAEFIASKVIKETTTNGSIVYSIRGIVPPDEFAIGFPLYTGVDNNPFTNYISKLALEFAIQINSKYKYFKDIPLWKDIADRLVILFDTQNQRHVEYEGFPHKNIYFGYKVKQADVLLLHFPLERYQMNSMSTTTTTNQTILKNDLNYNEYYTMFENGPAMTLQVHTIAWLLAKNITMANVRFAQSLQNMQRPFFVWTETADPKHHPMDQGCYQFITGVGGFLQSLTHGYAGMRIRNNELYFYQVIGFPNQNTSGVKLRNFKYLGSAFSMVRTLDKVELELVGKDMNFRVRIVATGQIYQLQKGTKVTFSNCDFTLFRVQ